MLSDLTTVLNCVFFETRVLSVKEMETVARLKQKVLQEGRTNVCYHLILTEVPIRVVGLVIGLSVYVEAWVKES